MGKSVVTISRKWNNPKILTTINDEEISLKIELSDFVDAVIQEIGSVTFTVRDSSFRAKVYQAVERVLEGVKEESAKVV